MRREMEDIDIEEDGYDPLEVRNMVRDYAAARAELESLWLKCARISSERDELQERVWQLEAENRGLKDAGEKMAGRIWGSEKALDDAVKNMQRLRDKLNKERAMHGRSGSSRFEGEF